jgi:uncharacterized membrane protein
MLLTPAWVLIVYIVILLALGIPDSEQHKGKDWYILVGAFYWITLLGTIFLLFIKAIIFLTIK